MDITQKRKILNKISKIQSQIDELEDIRYRLASSEFVSASTSSGTGAKSYTRQDLGKINSMLTTLKKELRSYRNLLSGTSNITSTTYFVYS